MHCDTDSTKVVILFILILPLVAVYNEQQTMLPRWHYETVAVSLRRCCPHRSPASLLDSHASHRPLHCCPCMTLMPLYTLWISIVGNIIKAGNSRNISSSRLLQLQVHPLEASKGSQGLGCELVDTKDGIEDQYCNYVCAVVLEAGIVDGAGLRYG
jgi:hypothetical protein